ncbi:cysteine desulfurase [Weissella minor]|uniref:cysteine desulfurase n=1 Tax=Weissella minor TaxID=1620 RepID=UPI001BAF2EF0|nr:cysteine desulfurase [Weissella minor]MBS0949896.1 cysteine desulfurase [Weissella minor]
MAFEKEIKIPGDDRTYVISPRIRRYALTDTGFVNQKNGTFVMERSLESMKPITGAVKLKVVVNGTLDGMKIKTLNPAGTVTVNLFKMKDNAEMVELYHFYLEELIQREIIDEK